MLRCRSRIAICGERLCNFERYCMHFLIYDFSQNGSELLWVDRCFIHVCICWSIRKLVKYLKICLCVATSIWRFDLAFLELGPSCLISHALSLRWLIWVFYFASSFKIKRKPWAGCTRLQLSSRSAEIGKDTCTILIAWRVQAFTIAVLVKLKAELRYWWWTFLSLNQF